MPRLDVRNAREISGSISCAVFVVAPRRILILSILFYVQKMARWDGGPKGAGQLRADRDVSGQVWPRNEMWEPDGVLEQRG